MMNEQINEFYHHFLALSQSLDEQYIQLKTELDQWHFNSIERIESMYLNTLIDLDTSYERLKTFRQTLSVLLDDERLVDSTVSITCNDLMNISARLSWIENEIDCLGNISYQISSDQIQCFARPCLIHSKRSSDVPSLTVPCRVLLKREQVEQLSEIVNKSQYSLITHCSSPEAILTTNNFEQLAVLIQAILSSNNEIRVLIHEYFAPLIIGQLGSRARMLKEKYSLTNIKIYPTCAPLSTERILLLSATTHEQIFQCLKEIYFNFAQTSSLERNQQAVFLYSPEFYDTALVDDYGGFLDRQNQLALPRILQANNTSLNDEDEMSEYEDEVVEDFDHENSNFTAETAEPLRERHWTLSDAQAGALFGPNSSRLHQIRSESNAWIVIYEAEGKNSRRPMSIRGTKAEIEHATKLILDTIKRHDRKLPLKQNHKRTR